MLFWGTSGQRVRLRRSGRLTASLRITGASDARFSSPVAAKSALWSKIRFAKRTEWPRFSSLRPEPSAVRKSLGQKRSWVAGQRAPNLPREIFFRTTTVPSLRARHWKTRFARSTPLIVLATWRDSLSVMASPIITLSHRNAAGRGHPRHQQSLARVQNLGQSVMASLVWGLETEQAYHGNFIGATDVSVNFCDHKSPWQLGSTENTKDFLHQDFPQETDMTGGT